MSDPEAKTHTIEIISKTLPKGDTMPAFADPKQKKLVVGVGDIITWEYDKDVSITIEPDTSFIGSGSGQPITHKRNVTIQLNGTPIGGEKVICYDISTGDTNTKLDPVIIIRDTNIRPDIFKNPKLAFIAGIVLGLIVGLMLG